ncbi:hypothetical protein [Chitinophaga rhizosphaerae]|uniref:hypothetical protein n=1 Tax=Chitinophaga rhizosphaerae TaxID=1864947 RepID=UPI000F814C5D|nr:hypothetical protein [Chitinophaga rhizosphaerae]
MKAPFWVMLIVSMYPTIMRAQNATQRSATVNPLSMLEQYASRATSFASKIKQSSKSILDRSFRFERRLADRIGRKDTAKAAQMRCEMARRYDELEKIINDSAVLDPMHSLYVPTLDSAAVLLKLFESFPLTPAQQQTLQQLQQRMNELQQTLTRSNLLQQALSERVRTLRSSVGNLGLPDNFKSITRQILAYKNTLAEYRALANEPDKLLAKLLQSAASSRLFGDLFRRYSMLAAILPPSPDIAILPLQAGTMQVRSAVLSSMGPNAASASFAQSLQGQSAATNVLQQIKDKLAALKQDRNLDEPADKEPADRKRRTGIKKLELGTNFQTAKSSQYFPTTSDIGLSLGYRMNERSTFGIGASYKMGWGKSIRHISLSHEGLSLRSFLNARVKGSFYATGALEYHYQKAFSEMANLPALRKWRQSALLGIMKDMPLGNRLLKRTQFQLLVDLLAIQTPYPPVQFRVGYQFSK